MKKKTVVKLSLVLCLLLCMSLVACDNDVKDEPHKAKSEWSSNETEHWHDCATEGCTEKFEKAAHAFGDWETKTPSGYGVPGEEKAVCSVCGYEKKRATDALEAKDNTVALKTDVAKSKTYDGNVIELSVDDFTRNGDGAITFAYRVNGGEGEFSNEAPKNAGTYEVKVSVAATAEWKACETIVEYTIDKYEWTEFYNTTHTKEYDGNAFITVEFNTLEDGTNVNIMITMESKDVGTKVKSVSLPGLLQNNNNYNAIDPSKISAEITPKKVGGLSISVNESDIDKDEDPVKIVRKIAGVKPEELEVNIEFLWGDLDNEDELEFALALPTGTGTGKCKISFKVENPNYEFASSNIGKLALVRETT